MVKVFMTQKKIAEKWGVTLGAIQKMKKDRTHQYELLRLGAIAMELGYTENELKFLRERRERELKELYQKRT